MKKVTIAMVGLSLVLGLGTFLLAPQAEAVSTEQIGEVCRTTSPATGAVSFFLGEDGSTWYTATRVAGGATMTTGNSDNPFDQGVAAGAPSGCTTAVTCNGFVSSTGLAGACTATGDTCSGIYVKAPGAGTFVDSPTVQQATPISSSNCNVIMTGSDKNFWYTQFDDAGTGGTATMGGGNPGKDPFNQAGESGNTANTAADGNGFVNQTSLSGQCTSLSRTCVGIWVKFP